MSPAVVTDGLPAARTISAPTALNGGIDICAVFPYSGSMLWHEDKSSKIERTAQLRVSRKG